MNDNEILERLKTDFAWYAERCLKIREKSGRVAPLILNKAQQHLHDALEEQRKRTGRVRAIVLKGRQQGVSTYVEARFYWQVTQTTGARAFILTHLDEASRNLYQIARRFHGHCPKIVRPKATRANKRELVFDEIDAGYHIGTAKSQGVGRSWTIQFFHGSEVAFWANAEEHVTGALQAVPDAEGTEVILESTSAGPDGLFYKMAAEAAAGRSDYQLVFIPWFWQEEYRKTPPDGFALTAEEEFYKERFGLDAAQMFWRRQKIINLGGIFAFRREYPASAEEAFHADLPQALWSRAQIEDLRVAPENAPEMKRIVVAVDPAVTSKTGSAETGIVVAGLGADNHAYVLADLSGKYTPLGWAHTVVAAYRQYEADRVVAEVNQGGDLVECTLRSIDPQIAYKPVRASRGKVTRAEPVAALDFQGRVHHAGRFEKLEDQMCGYDPLTADASPDRMDARVWAVTELLLSGPLPGGPRVWR